jgi:type VI secretion system protein VasJ
MLGLGKSKNTWKWAACGKHPVAKDYFRVNLNTPLLAAFESWVEKGYLALNSRSTSARRVYSWRFWAKGIKKGSLICGVGKDSSDSIGRPYPLLIMGDGTLDGWEKHWDLLHHAFAKTWDQIEYISAKRFDDLRALEDEVSAIKNPGHNWAELKSQKKNLNDPQAVPDDKTCSMDKDEILKNAGRMANEMEALIPLEGQSGGDPFVMANLWNALLKAHCAHVPNAIFMGGVPEKHFLAVFNRPLNANDFIRLWSVTY